MHVARPPRPTRSIKPGGPPPGWVVDAAGQTLGRLSTRIAMALRGKNDPRYTPHTDTGEFVVVVNAERVKLTGRKRSEKTYYRHTGYKGHLKSVTAEHVLTGAHPERVIETAVRGMLPKNALGRRLYRKLKVYAGPDHPHAAQKPQELTIG